MAKRKKTLSPDDREKVAQLIREIRDEVRALRIRLEQRRGAKVSGAEVEVHIVVDYGANITAVATLVQGRVSDYLAQMADARPTAVNVVVDDVQRP